MLVLIVIYLHRRSHIAPLLEFYADHQAEWNRLGIQVKIIYSNDFQLPAELVDSILPFQRVKRIKGENGEDYTPLYSFIFETARRVFYIGSEAIQEVAKRISLLPDFDWKRFLKQPVPSKTIDPSLMFLIRPNRSLFQYFIKRISTHLVDLKLLLEEETIWNLLDLQQPLCVPDDRPTILKRDCSIQTDPDFESTTTLQDMSEKEIEKETEKEIEHNNNITDSLPYCIQLPSGYQSIEDRNNECVSLVYMRASDPEDPKNKWRSPVPRGNSHPLTYCRKYWDHILSHRNLWDNLDSLSGQELGDTVRQEDSIGQVLIGLLKKKREGLRREDLVYSFDEWIAQYPSHYFGRDNLPVRLSKRK